MAFSLEEWKKRKQEEDNSEGASTSKKTEPSSGFSYSEWKKRKQAEAQTKNNVQSAERYSYRPKRTVSSTRKVALPTKEELDTTVPGRIRRAEAQRGWNSYLADQEAARKAEAERPWWQTLGENMQKASYADLPGVNVLQMADQYRQDTSWQEPSDRWDEKHKRDFGYLYDSDPDAARDYAAEFNDYLDRMEKQKKQEALREEVTKNFGNGVAGTAKAIGAKALGGIGEFTQDVAENLGRGRITERGTYLSPTEYSNAITGGISEHLNEKSGTLSEDIPVIGGKGLGDVYQLVASVAQSMLSAHTLGQFGTLVSYFGQAAASGVDDARNRGASDEQALTYGALSGLAEGLTEEIGVDRLLNIGSASTMRQLLGNIAKQGVGEGLEEGITALLDTFADNLVLQDRSKMNVRMAEYTANGMSEEEARKQAWWDAVEDTLYDMFGGFVSGGVSGGLETGVKSLAGRFGGRNTATAEAKTAADEVVPEPTAASEEEIRHEPVAEEVPVSATDPETRKIIEPEAVDTLEETVAKEVPVIVTDPETQARHAVDAETETTTVPAEVSSEDTDDIGARINAMLDSLIELSAEAKTAKPAEAAQKLVGSAWESSRNAVENPEAEILDDDTEGEVLEGIRDLGLKDEENEMLLKNFRGSGVDKTDYMIGVRTAYQYGEMGIPAREMTREGNSASALTEYQRKAAYDLGRLYGEEEARREQVAMKGKAVPGGTGKVTYEGDWNKLNAQQTAGLTALDTVADALGVEFRIFESYTKEGSGRVYRDASGSEVVAPNGYYRNGVVHLDVNAGNDAKGTILFTASHELTHFMKEWSPEKFRKLSDALMGEYDSRGVSVDYLVNEQISKARKQGYDLSYEDAFEEVVADSMESMLADGRIVERLAELKETDRSVWEKIRDWIRDFAEKIRKAYAKLTPDSEEGRMVARMTEATDQLQRLFEEGLTDAGQNFAGAEKNTAGVRGEVKFSLRTFEDGTRFVDVAADPHTFDGMTVAEMNKVAKDILMKKFAGKVIGMDNRAFVNGDSVNEYIHPSKSIDLETRKTKLAAAGELDNLLDAGTYLGNRADGADGHIHPDAIDFSYYGTIFKVGSEYFWGKVNIKNIKRGRLLKDVTQIKNITQDIVSSYGDNPKSNFLRDASMDSIRGSEQNVNEKFSLRTPVEQTKTLVAMHNLTADKLIKAIELGGFPMPSIAVTRADIPHTNFGEITLVMNKSAVDPEANRKNTVYSADAWTPTFPRVEYEADTAVDDRARKTLSRYESRIAPQFQSDLRKIKYGLEDLLNSQGGEQELVRHVMENYGLKATYLESQGKHVDEVRVEQEIPKKYSEAAIEKYEAMIAVLGTRDPAELGTTPLKNIRDNYGPELEKIVPGISKTGMRLGRFIGQVVDYLMDDGSGPSTETVTDYAATRKAVDDALDADGYEAWVRELYFGIEKDRGIHNGKERFTPSGRSRSFQQTHLSVTLDNIAKAMAAQNGGNTKNVAGFNGVKTLRAGTAERFKSIQAMHDREGRLRNLSEEEQNALTDELNSRLYDLIDGIDRETGKIGGSNNLMRFDLIGQILMEASETGRYNVADVQKVFRENHHEISDGTALKVKELLFDVSQMPVNLFEAKPERAVRFDEVLAAVVPENAGEDLKAALKKTGVPVLEYAEGNTQDRMRKVNSVEGARFSLRDPEYQKVQQELEKENAKLREDVKDLKALVKLQRTVTGGTKFAKSSVEAAAGLLMEKAGVTRGKSELSPILNQFYEYIAKGEELSWEGVQEQAQEAVRWLMGNASHKTGPDEYSREILSTLRTMRISLNDAQKAEAASRYGSFNQFRKSMMGSVIITNDGTPLDEAWQELADAFPGKFSADTGDADMPLKLAEIIDSLRSSDTREMEYLYNREMMAQDLTREVYDSYWQVSTLKTYADVKQKEITMLKVKHSNQMDKLRSEHREKTARLMAEHRAALAGIRKEHREAMQKQAKEASTRYQESRKKASESRQRTEMRHRIQKVVKKLNDLLLNETKDHHVPDSMKRAVADALDVVNMDTVGADARIAELDAQIAKAKTEEKKQELMEARVRVAQMGGRMKERLDALKTAYDSIRTEGADPLVANSYDEVISGKIQETVDLVGNTPLRDMSMEQLGAVYELYTAVSKSISSVNKAFKAAKGETIAQLGNSVMEEAHTVGGSSESSVKALEGVKSFGWNNLKPVYAFRTIGSDTLTGLFENVRAGEDIWAKDVQEAKKFYREKARKYGAAKWDFDKRYSFESNTGKAFELNLQQMMSLYAYSKRSQADQHLAKGGFVFDGDTTFKDKVRGIPVEKVVKAATAYNLNREELGRIVSTLTAEQRAFVDEMQSYLSDTMGAKGNEVSMELYGIRLFKEKNYFPLKSAKQFIFEQTENTGEVRLKNSGFSKKTVINAGNPVVLSGFMDVWATHVNDMSMYHAFVLPLEDFNRVFNYKSTNTEDTDSASVKMVIQNAYGAQAEKYIKQLLTDLNGGARVDPTTGGINKMMGIFKKGAVFASFSVVVQQPSAIARAMALVDAKYFIGPSIDQKRHNALWEEVKQYAPVAMIKEMGYFDTNMGRSTVDYITAEEYGTVKEKAKALFADSGYRDEVLSRLPALADEVSWCYIWESVKRETAAKYPGMERGSDAFLKKTGERFTEVIVQTQVYDSVLSRSANMRSKDTGMKMATAFLAEPTTSINMVADALLQAKREDGKYARKAIGSVIASQVLNAILVSFVYAARDDDEDKTYGEKYITSFVGSVLDSMNPLTYLPFLKDIVSIVQGYEVERSDMAVISDLYNAWQKLGSDQVSTWKKVEDFAGSIAQIFGLPLKNIMRDVRGVYQVIQGVSSHMKTTGAGVKYAAIEGATGQMVSNQQQLYEAMLSGDTEHAKRVRERYTDDRAANTALTNAIRDALESEDIGPETAMEQLEEFTGRSAEDARDRVRYWVFKDEYPGYELSEAAVSTYYNEIEASGIRVEQYAEYLEKLPDNATKEETLAVINSMKLTRVQKDALYLSEGYAQSKLSEAPWH